MSRRHQHDDEDEDEVRAKEELAANMVAPQVVPGDKVATAPGDRIAYVMFVGQLPNMPAGYWVGVQYEEKVGKNDGTLHGKRYFTCPPGHGGFLRSAKVQSLEDLASKNEAREAALVAEAQGQNRRKSTGKALSTSAKGKSSTSPKSGRPGETFDQPEDEGKELGEAEAQTPSAGGLSRRSSMMGWSSGRLSSARFTGSARTARSVYERPPHATHPYRVRVSGSGLSQSVVGSLAQFTITACDAEGNKRTSGGDNFAVIMRGARRSGSQPALVRTKLTDRMDGTYMCEYRPWMTGQYYVEVRLDVEKIRGSRFTLNVITLRPDAGQCVVRGDALNRAVARVSQKFDVLFVDAIGHTAHAEELDVYVEPYYGGEQGTTARGGMSSRNSGRSAVGPASAPEPASAPMATDTEEGKKAGKKSVSVSNTVVEDNGPASAPAGPEAAAPRSTSPGSSRSGTNTARVADPVDVSDGGGGGGKARPLVEDAAPEAEPDGATRELAPSSAATYHRSDTGSAPLKSAMSSARAGSTDGVTPRTPGRPYTSRMKRLDAPTRQRHLQLWQTRIAADKFLNRRAAESAFRETGYGDEGKKKKKIGGEPGQPSFMHELSADKFGFAFGGVDPGTLHAHGKLIKVHHVSYSVGLAGRYKLHVGLRQQMLPLPGSPFDLSVEPGSAYAGSTRLPTDKYHLSGMADEEWQMGLVLRTADMLGNLCEKGGAALTMSLPKRWAADHELDENPVNCRVVDKADGSYECDWSSTLAGTFPLEVCIDGAHVAGSPISVTVKPAKPDVNRFVASGAGLAKAVAGVPAPMRIRVADRFDNTADIGSTTQFGLVLVPQAGAAAFGKGDKKKVEQADGPKGKKNEKGGGDAAKQSGQSDAKLAAKPDALKSKQLAQESQPFVGSWVNGCYEIKYVAEQAGVLDLNLWCEVDGGTREPLPGSPFSVHVSEGDASPIGSFVRDAEASKQGSGIIAGEHVILRPQVHDQFGNPSSAPEGALTAILDSPGHMGEQLEPPKLRSGLGSYELTLEPLKAGEHSVHILLHGEEITGSPVKFYVSPAAPNSQKCYLSRPDAEPCLVNAQAEILLLTHDKYGNQLDRGGVRVDAKAAGVAASACTVEDHKNGTYTIRLTAGAPGEVKVTARIDSVEIKTLSVFFAKASSTDDVDGKGGGRDGSPEAARPPADAAADGDVAGAPATSRSGASGGAGSARAFAPSAAEAPSSSSASAPSSSSPGKKGGAKGGKQRKLSTGSDSAFDSVELAPDASTASVEPTGGVGAPSASKAGSPPKKGGKKKGKAPAGAPM